MDVVVLVAGAFSIGVLVGWLVRNWTEVGE